MGLTHDQMEAVITGGGFVIFKGVTYSTIESLPSQEDIDAAYVEPEAPSLIGKSAYDIAVDNGFVGNEVSWLASLQGSAGAAGADGGAGAPQYVGTATLNNVGKDQYGWHTVIPSGTGSLTIPANSLAVGSTIKTTLNGYYNLGSPGSYTTQIKPTFGGADLNAVELPTAVGNSSFHLEITVTCRAIGASGELSCTAIGYFGAADGTTKTLASGFDIGNTVVSTAANKTFDIIATIGDKSVNNYINITDCTIEVL